MARQMFDADAGDVQASGVPALSPWSMATTPEHLWDTSSPSMTPSSSRTQGLSSTQELSSAAPSQGLSHTAAFMPHTSAASSAQRLMIASVGLAASSPAQAGAAAGRHCASTEHSRILSGSPMAGLGRTGPQVRMTKKQQMRCWQQMLWICGLCDWSSSLLVVAKQQDTVQTLTCIAHSALLMSMLFV